jgi:hypothetical protein
VCEDVAIGSVSMDLCEINEKPALPATFLAPQNLKITLILSQVIE